MHNISMYQLDEALLGAIQTLTDNGGQVTPEIEAILAFDAENFAVKAERYCHVIADLKGKAAAAKMELDRIKALHDAYEGQIQTLKFRLQSAVELRGGKANAGTFALRTQNNGGKAPVILADNIDAATLPEDMRIVKFTPNVDEIRNALEAGKSMDFAKLGDRGKHLRGI